ncbi:MAG: transcription termination factor Rho, partial [Raoultibacter sp.]
NRQNNKQNNNNNNNGGRDNNRRQRRQHQGPNREPVVPQTSREDLEKLKVADLRAKAEELSIDATGLLKADLVDKVYDACIKAEGFLEVKGILDILADGYGFLRTQGYLPSETDAYVGLSTIRRNGLRKGDMVVGQVKPPRENEKYAAIHTIISVNGKPLNELGKRVRFADLTPIYPDQRLWMEHGKNTITARVIDLAAPIGKGQRGLIVSPPKAGKTTVLKDIAASISANNPEVHLMCLLVDERPEEVTDMERSIKGEVVSSTFDMPCENHIAVSELVIERAKRLVEEGADVVILLDSLTRLARAYNLAQPASGRILSGGVDSTALYPPKRFLGAARNIEGGGSLTILASALVDTGSKMDEVIFEEFKGTGNMELRLDRNLADRRIFPAIDPVASGTRKEDLLLEPQEAPLIWAVRRILSNMNSSERAMDMLIKSLKQTDTNQEFLLRTAKKAQKSKTSDSLEL